MKKLLLFFIFLGFLSVASAQRVYFIYLQSESGQRFFVKLGEKFHNSSSSGYLILSKLQDSVYNLTVGFPDHQWPDQFFSVAVGNRDHGLLLKNFAEKGWGLFDVETMSVLMSASPKPVPKQLNETTNKKDVSAFTEMLSKASDDPSLKEKQVELTRTEKKPDTKVVVSPPVKESEKAVETFPLNQADNSQKDLVKEKPLLTDTLSRVEKVVPAETKQLDRPVTEKKPAQQPEKETIKTEPVVTEKKPVEKPNDPLPFSNKEGMDTQNKKMADEQTKAKPYQPSVVSKWSESSTTSGFGLVFIDELNDGNRDTVRIFIPNPNIFIAAKTDEKRNDKQEDKRFLDISTEIPVKQTHNDSVLVKSEITKDEGKQMTLANQCTAIADENDFFQLRKNMAAVNGNDEMIAQAKNYFVLKCFTTEQIKNLSTLFLQEEGKYRFFDAAYDHVSDAANFPVLEKELKEEYYANRFKAMLRN